MMELGSSVTWTKLCNLFYVFFILLVLKNKTQYGIKQIDFENY